MIDVDKTPTEDYINDQEPDQASYTKQVMDSKEYKDDMEEIDHDAGYDEYKEKRAGVWKEMGWE